MMQFKKWLFLLLFPLFGLTALVLFLNWYEVDVYPHALTEPPTEANNIMPPQWLPETIAHACVECGECIHTLKLEINRIVLVVHDRDGWYRLFWAGEEVYYYDDPAYFSASLKNPTADSPEGTWEIKGRYVPATHNHDCGGELMSTFHLNYELITGTTPDPVSNPFPEKWQWMSYNYDGVIATFSWLQANQESATAACDCGR